MGPELSEPLFFALVALVSLVAGFSHGVTGFGVGIVAISFLSLFMPIYQSAALAALVALTTGIVIFIKYRDSFQIRPVLKLLGGAVLGIPIGIVLIRTIPESYALRLMGLVVAGFSLYSLTRPRIPRLRHANLAYGFGFVSGSLAGAFNAGGPPAIIYGLCSGWTEREFKTNITGYMMSNMVLLIVLHGVAGNITHVNLKAFAIAMPILILAVLTGLRLARHLRPALLKKIVLGFLLVIGAKYLFFAGAVPTA
jgi:uncharacterized membrane protein YfcA